MGVLHDRVVHYNLQDLLRTSFVAPDGLVKKAVGQIPWEYHHRCRLNEAMAGQKYHGFTFSDLARNGPNKDILRRFQPVPITLFAGVVDNNFQPFCLSYLKE